MANLGGPTAVSLALVDHQRILWAEAFGFLDKPRGLAPTTDTRFGLASGSKVFAAIATLILVDRGLIGLDTPLVHYVPDFRMAQGQAYARITPRLLLSHSSGLPGTDYRNGTTFFPVKGHAAQVMATLASQRLKHAPGEMAVYCNDGFSLIEPLVAAVTGQAYTDFIRQEIFRPLGMRHSRFGIETLAPDSYATALRVNGETYPQEYINVLSTGGIYSTPSDMGRLAMMLMAAGREGENRLLSASAVTEMGLNQSATLPLNPLHENDFGLGWDGVRQGGLAAVGVTAWHKNGGSTFFSTQFDVAPDEHLAVMIMAAGGDLAVETLAERILLQALAERRSIAGMPAPLTPHPPPPIPTPEADLLALVGHYAAEKLYRLEPGDDQSLTWSEFVDGAWLERISGLQRRQGGDWIADSVPDRALLVIEADGRPHLALREPKGLKHYASARILGQLLASLAPLSTPWLARLQHRWLMVNDPYSTLLALGMPPLFNLWQAPGLRGYLMAAGKVVNPSASDERALMWTKVAARDLNDLIIVIRNGEEWVLWGSSLYRPLATLSLLATGHHLIAIGDEGLGEWRRLTAAAVLKVTAANSWYLYGPDFQLLNAVVKDRAITLGWDGRITGPAYLLVRAIPGRPSRLPWAKGCGSLIGGVSLDFRHQEMGMTGIVTERGGDKRSPGTQVTGTGRPPAPGSQMIAMARVTLRFYAELNDFLPPERRQRDVVIDCVAPAPVRHLIELCGVPHTEVELIIRKGESLGLEATIEAGDRVAVYPLFEAFDVRPALRLGLRPKRVPRFLADAHLGALAKGLRLLGFDTLWHNDLGDEALVELSRREHRILLTRDRRLLMRRNLTHGCYIRPTKPREQVDYLVARLQLCADLRPFSRCMVCNGELVAVVGEAVMTRIPPRVWATPRAYWRCPGCERLYWRGSHWQAMCRRIDELCPGIERE